MGRSTSHNRLHFGSDPDHDTDSGIAIGWTLDRVDTGQAVDRVDTGQGGHWTGWTLDRVNTGQD